MSDIKTFRFRPNDTLMFREGSPFNQGDEGASSAQSVFPPYPPSLVGAIRLAIAQQMGFTGKNWPKEALGDGVDWQADKCNLNNLRFGPPMVEKCDGDAYTPLFPAPLHLVKDKNDKFALLSPGGEFTSDIGRVRFPVAPDGLEGLKTQEDHYITLTGMKAILSGQAPDPKDILENLWATETRVGIGINPDTRNVHDGALYTAGHIRMSDDIALSISLEGLSHDFTPTTQVLGGEHRMSEIEARPTPENPFPQTAPNKARCALIALSPVYLSEPPLPGRTLKGVSGNLVSGAIGKPIWVGGWNSQNNRPIPMRQLIPAGSVFFIEGAENIKIGATVKIGKSTNWGFGHCLVANWRC